MELVASEVSPKEDFMVQKKKQNVEKPRSTPKPSVDRNKLEEETEAKYFSEADEEDIARRPPPRSDDYSVNF